MIHLSFAINAQSKYVLIEICTSNTFSLLAAASHKRPYYDPKVQI